MGNISSQAVRGRRMTVDLFWSGCSTVVTLGTGLALQFIVGNALSVADMGTYMFALAVFLTVGGIVSGGFSSATVIEAARRADEPGVGRSIVVAGALLSAGVGCAGGLLLYGVSGPLTAWCHMPGLRPLLSGFAVALPLFLVNRVLLTSFTAQSRMSAQAAGYTVRLLLVGMCTAACVARWHALARLGYALALAELLLLPFLIWLEGRGGTGRPRLSRATLQPLIRLALPLTLSAGLSNLDTRLDLLITAPLLGDPAQVGLFSLALNMTLPVLAGAEAMQRVFISGFCRHAGRERHAQADDLFSTSSGMGVLTTGFSALFLAALAPAILQVLFPQRPELQAAVPCLVLLLPAAIIRGGDIAVSGCFAALGAPRYSVWLTAVRLTVRLGLLCGLVPILGLVGAAAATGGTWILKAVLTFALMTVCLQRHLRYRYLLTVLGSSLLAYALIQWTPVLPVRAALSFTAAVAIAAVVWRTSRTQRILPEK